MAETFGSWQLDGLVAVGGLAEVWRGRRGERSDAVELAAVKRLHTHLLHNDEATRMFAHEQRLAVELPRHPNVVHAIDSGAVDGRPYVALELAPGVDVRRMLAPAANAAPGTKRAALAKSRALAIVARACEAAAHLHAHGWIHGDINPGNLVVDDGDGLVLIDLGIARRAGEAGTVRGTHAYMAPEQVRGEPWTPATDVFALGVVLWELIAGARLFHRGPSWLSMAAVVEDAVPALSDPAIDAIARAALEKASAARTASASELAASLELLISS
ncbi:MAG TPA: serine/threonine-protein kinase [Kofleriaceae bacterium]|jgi:serine/threonine-protein kinase